MLRVVASLSLGVRGKATVLRYGVYKENSCLVLRQLLKR